METPEFFQGGYYNTQFTPEKRHSDTKPGDHFVVEDLLDFPNDDAVVATEAAFDNVTGTSAESSTVTVVDSCNSSFSGNDPHFSGEMGCRSLADAQFSSDICVPYDDLAELEWLSNFVEESFSSEDLQKLQLISGMKARTEKASEAREFPQDTTQNNPIFHPEVAVPGKARSKRSRAAPCNWTSRLLVLSPTTTPSTSESDIGSEPGKKTVKATPKKKEMGDIPGSTSGGDGRKCLHCATDKTPQWRTGPMGPKTLCNACGVRYKSGRLVPEYRPASSPTFVLTKHSNSHRKVLELRRQKEMQRAQQQQQQFLHHNMMFDVSNGDDYLIHQHIGPDFRQLI
ncbi:GATA transcription factor 12-like [Cornus florida]|uniref:GATA transcription factor 12-like n=1 Tax=Cornus florida TaxID=4283 RepID=UPI0028A009FF|nr:GATA transcription factor 12-like [Cornus florida]